MSERHTALLGCLTLAANPVRVPNMKFRRIHHAKVYNIIDCFEGDKVKDPESIYHGKRMRNGWKNTTPWTYHLDPELVWLPSKGELEILSETLDL